MAMRIEDVFRGSLGHWGRIIDAASTAKRCGYRYLEWNDVVYEIETEARICVYSDLQKLLPDLVKSLEPIHRGMFGDCEKEFSTAGRKAFIVAIFAAKESLDVDK